MLEALGITATILEVQRSLLYNYEHSCRDPLPLHVKPILFFLGRDCWVRGLLHYP